MKVMMLNRVLVNKKLSRDHSIIFSYKNVCQHANEEAILNDLLFKMTSSFYFILLNNQYT